MSETASTASGSSADQNEVPVAVAAWNTIAAAVAASPRRTAPTTIPRAILAKLSDAASHPLPPPATCPSAGNQTPNMKTSPPTANAIAR